MHIFTVWAETFWSCDSEGSREDGAGGEMMFELSSATSRMFILTEVPEWSEQPAQYLENIFTKEHFIDFYVYFFMPYAACFYVVIFYFWILMFAGFLGSLFSSPSIKPLFSDLSNTSAGI